ncbi:MAG: hypothetical protein H7A25_25915 [Leptospiraceae bacterium]|nr:hypothetical protein [Leptospiraceae bacterium]
MFNFIEKDSVVIRSEIKDDFRVFIFYHSGSMEPYTSKANVDVDMEDAITKEKMWHSTGLKLTNRGILYYGKLNYRYCMHQEVKFTDVTFNYYNRECIKPKKLVKGRKYILSGNFPDFTFVH